MIEILIDFVSTLALLGGCFVFLCILSQDKPCYDEDEIDGEL